MKARRILVLILTTLIVLSACDLDSNNTSYEDILESIKEPSNHRLLVEGSFETVEMTPLTEVSDDILKKYSQGPKLYISENFIEFAGVSSKNPDFKSRYVNYENFLNYYNIDIERELDMDSGPVLTISDGQFFYQNIYQLNDDKIGLVDDGILFIMEKISDEVPEKVIAEAESPVVEETDQEDKEEVKSSQPSSTAVFIALKVPLRDDDNNLYFDYYTISLKRDKEGNYSLSAIEDIFLPSKNGLYLTGMDHITGEEGSEDKFFFNSLSIENDVREYIDIGEGASNQILYLGNGYLDIETKEYNAAHRKYRLYSTQKLEKDESLNITDIVGEGGLKSFIEDTSRAINKNNIDAEAIDLLDIYNIGMNRSKGKWQYKSNLAVEEEGQLVVTDYLLDIVPLVNITNDSLALSWEDIQTRFPNVRDAYTSPQKDILLVQKPQLLMFFEVDNGIIADEPIFIINTGEYDQIVMTEWVSGALAEEWTEVFKKQEKRPLRTME